MRRLNSLMTLERCRFNNRHAAEAADTALGGGSDTIEAYHDVSKRALYR